MCYPLRLYYFVHLWKDRFFSPVHKFHKGKMVKWAKAAATAAHRHISMLLWRSGSNRTNSKASDMIIRDKNLLLFGISVVFSWLSVLSHFLLSWVVSTEQREEGERPTTAPKLVVFHCLHQVSLDRYTNNIKMIIKYKVWIHSYNRCNTIYVAQTEYLYLSTHLSLNIPYTNLL